MSFASDTVEALESGVFLANSELEPDTLETFEDLTEFYARFEFSGRPPGEGDLERVRAIRTPLRRLFSATRDEAVPLVNAILAEQHALPRLVRHDGRDWHIHGTSDDAPLHARILVETAMAMIDVIRADEMTRLDRCAMDDCEGVVLDMSRNRSRKYCSPTCTNRAAVHAYRARQAAED
ncbi:CGNR zinc finger domain-containing protein [Demequina pelophila]|uniref:CGNR zinc finger domain-containing protein n=1 Tax=Demequina pelophila TaxID=1638984 RepID=UPI00078119C5|nr:CGNR zinc finger domain-containing protein [Demequina pelophila]